MRQLKTFMRNRKKEMIWCGPCECRTLQCRRYANENCGCGEEVAKQSITFDTDYSGTTIDVWGATTIWFTVTPEDSYYHVNLSNESFTIESTYDSWAHHEIVLRAIHAWHDWLIPCDITIEGTDTSITTTIYASQPVESIWQPSEDNIQVLEWYNLASFTFDYTPVNANTSALGNYIDFTSGDSNIAYFGGLNPDTTGNWTAEAIIVWVAPGTTTITYTLNRDQSQTYTVNVETTSLP